MTTPAFTLHTAGRVLRQKYSRELARGIRSIGRAILQGGAR